MKYTQQVWRWTWEMLECPLDNCNSDHKHNIDCNTVYKGVLQISAFVFCSSVQLIPNLKQYCTQNPNCCINTTNPSLNQWRNCRKLPSEKWLIWIEARVMVFHGRNPEKWKCIKDESSSLSLDAHSLFALLKSVTVCTVEHLHFWAKWNFQIPPNSCKVGLFAAWLMGLLSAVLTRHDKRITNSTVFRQQQAPTIH